ncbi:transitional endoplasmic reticulum ATPase [Enhydrobacter aerosaccus]|uniref:Transitional endoplasmic reticulum ATPase n=1 Tax=Enhydrobacter aerosaccus TaxID=225324 RepID=A0A1T4LUQ1_9HYPH|nr:CDC48 family AAA ATPase [Enhydrobacter aerosaccus]SJZ58469.1 transitional endoplasmic reticulum ATPase [Enhydrobacter aerosaccus]
MADISDDVMSTPGATKPPEELSRKVAEALARDVGRGLVRVDPADMAALGINPGDVVRLIGDRETAAKAMPAFPMDRGKGIVQIDGLTRDNAKVSLGDRIRLETTRYAVAARVKLAPAELPRAGTRKDYVAKLLEGLVITEGDRVRATLMGTRTRDFTVLKTVPAGPVVISSTTSIDVSQQQASQARERIAYEDIGGLQRELSSIREMIELPLRHPEIFEQMGIDPPKGVLLQGPPGCGKTLIARAVANETDAKFFGLSGPEIMHKFYGESEAHLRKVFEQAAKGPSIIFLDEIDAIAPKRTGLGSEQQVERRVVSQLLTLMDGLQSRGQVIVIGATNLPDAIDPALRRPGRFDREITIGVPDKPGRLQILQVHTRGMPLAEDVSLDRLAQVTHGFVGADLQSLCREAAMARLRRMFPTFDLSQDQIPVEVLQKLTVGVEDFDEALTLVEPSAIREVFTEVADVKWADVGGLEEAKRILKESIEWPALHPDLFKKAAIVPPKGILLYGPPGVGKTLLAKAVATESGANFISVKGPALMSRWVGETERAVRDLFHKAKLASPCIVFLDEIDSIAPRRGGSEATSVTDRTIAQLLTEMDGVQELRGVVVLAATNRKDLVDPALLRAGRFDFLIKLPLPDAIARLEILKVHTRARPLADDVDLAALAGAPSNGQSGADIELACRNASLAAIREYLAGPSGAVGKGEDLVIGRRHFEAALHGTAGGRVITSGF